MHADTEILIRKGKHSDIKGPTRGLKGAAISNKTGAALTFTASATENKRGGSNDKSRWAEESGKSVYPIASYFLKLPEVIS
jgi:hypothetical protein